MFLFYYITRAVFVKFYCTGTVFNEWHCANTSKKLRTVFHANAKAGKYMATFCTYGYYKADDDKRTPLIDPEAAAVVERIFKMRASGMGHKSIADALNQEHIVPVQ